ncbi:MAG: PhzF family phenazine biosynthesis protein [Fervidobacterium sp.]
MESYIVDAFTSRPFFGNPAGVVLLSNNRTISKDTMQLIAKELKFSETAFVKRKSEDEFTVLFFTPTSEIDLCGHATIASFTVLREKGYVKNGSYIMNSRAGKLEIIVESISVFMEQAEPKMGQYLEISNVEFVAEMLGINPEDVGDEKYNLLPAPVTTGLWDLIVPVKSKKVLFNITPDFEKISDFCRLNEIVSFHVFTLDEERALANCRDFAPLYGIPEESATGTANGALGFYLFKHGIIELNKTYKIIQGEGMGRMSEIYVRVSTKGSEYRCYVGGEGKILFEGLLNI